jgi:hypothetical protein
LRVLNPRILAVRDISLSSTLVNGVSKLVKCKEDPKEMGPR